MVEAGLESSPLCESRHDAMSDALWRRLYNHGWTGLSAVPNLRLIRSVFM